jgi:hypothetical protein
MMAGILPRLVENIEKMNLAKNGNSRNGDQAAMYELIKDTKAGFRKSQKGKSVEEKIQQLYAMQDRYLAISRAAIQAGMKRDDREYRRACRLLGRNVDL